MMKQQVERIRPKNPCWRETKGKIPTPNNPKPSVNTCKLKVWAVWNEGFLPERLLGWLLTHAFPNNLSPGVVPDRRVVPGFCRCSTISRCPTLFFWFWDKTEVSSACQKVHFQNRQLMRDLVRCFPGSVAFLFPGEYPIHSSACHMLGPRPKPMVLSQSSLADDHWLDCNHGKALWQWRKTSRNKLSVTWMWYLKESSKASAQSGL